jgi:hypothetical protein
MKTRLLNIIEVLKGMNGLFHVPVTSSPVNKVSLFPNSLITILPVPWQLQGVFNTENQEKLGEFFNPFSENGEFEAVEIE